MPKTNAIECRMAGGDELNLLGTWPSSFVTRVQIAVGLKGLSFEYAEEDLNNKSELLLSSNPVHKKVPVLIHDGKPISESQIILQYIDEAFNFNGAFLLSADLYERAVARFWAAYIDDKACIWKSITHDMAGGDELKLLGAFPSAYVTRVELALGFKGLSYEYVKEDLANKSELLLSSNPVHKKVPVLIHNGKPISESQVIVQYIDEAFPGAGVPLLPSDPYERAVARFWAAYIDDKLLKSWLQASMGKTEEEKAEALKETFAAVANLEAAFEGCSKGKPFFGGDAVGYLDVTLGALVSWVHAGEALYGMRLFDATRSPLLDAWVDRFAALDAAKAALPDAGRLAEYAKKRQGGGGARGGGARR
uniref:glutathione transferase n=1 Tax=Oryza rufipogon TaxID=4529 RepID=A0A0E0R1P0_ORYRU